MLKHILQLWDQAGERPYEVLQEEGLYDDFIRYLDASSLSIPYPIFRGTRRHADLKINDLLSYGYPTSWSNSYDKAFNFVESGDTPVILSFTSVSPVRALLNPYNSYNEEEVIIHPITLRVTNKYTRGKTTVIDVVPA